MTTRVAKSVPFGTRLAPSTAKLVRSFSRKTKMPISTITNSALRFFIEESKKIAAAVDGKPVPITPLTNDALKVKSDVDRRVAISRLYRGK